MVVIGVDRITGGQCLLVCTVGDCAHTVFPLLFRLKSISSGNPAKQAEHDQDHQERYLVTHFPKTPHGVFAGIGTFSKGLASLVAPASKGQSLSRSE